MSRVRKAAAAILDWVLWALVVLLGLGILIGLPALFVFAMRCAWKAGGA